ncbi:MAG: hypothetical protein GY757_30080 [bacterium]|nr:hypothetical protein [bacterium]
MIEGINNGFDINLFKNSRAEVFDRREDEKKEENAALNPANGSDTIEKSESDDSQHYKLDLKSSDEHVEKNPQQSGKTEDAEKDKGSDEKVSNDNDAELTEEEQQKVQELKETDRKVRQHEMAHLAAAQGISTSGATFEYTRGPDGANYAVGGEVNIDTSEESSPEKTIDKARKIAAAAMAPADPSGQDRQVAAKARAMEANAQAELAKERQQEAEVGKDDSSASPVDTDNSKSEKTNVEKIHPGIKSYEQNQSFGNEAFGNQSLSQNKSDNLPFMEWVA